MTELRAALEKRGLSTDGLKADLINRLQQRLDEEEFGLDSLGAGAAEARTSVLAPVATDVENEVNLIASVSRTKGVAKSDDVTPKTKPSSATFSDSAAAASADGASLVEKRKARALRFGMPAPPTTVQAADEGELVHLEEEIKNAKRMGMPFKRLVQKKKDIEQRQKEKSVKREGDKKQQHPDGDKEDDKNRKRGGGGDGDGVIGSTTNFGRVKKQRGNPPSQRQQQKKPANELEGLSKEELQKRLDRAIKFNLGTAVIDKIKAEMRKYRFGNA